MSAPRWSQRARADLKAIHDYIAKDSPANAKAVSDQGTTAFQADAGDGTLVRS